VNAGDVVWFVRLDGTMRKGTLLATPCRRGWAWVEVDEQHFYQRPADELYEDAGFALYNPDLSARECFTRL
jgi:hypothetical protein